MSFSEDLDQLVEQVATAAIVAYMHEHTWDLYGGSFLSPNWDTALPGPLVCTADITVTKTGVNELREAPPGGKPTGNPGEYTVNPWFDIYEPWRDSIKEIFEGWESLPETDPFDDMIANLTQALSRLTAVPADNPLNGDPSFPGNTDLASKLDLVKRWASPDSPDAWTGDLIITFDEGYGTRLGPVILNQSKIAIALGMGLTGGKKILASARTDITTIARDAKKAFEDAASDDITFETALAVADLASAFLPSAAGKVIDVTSKTYAIAKDLQPAATSLAKTATVSGSSAQEVLDSLGSAVRALNALVCDRELALADSTIDGMIEVIADSPRDTFHIDPNRGLYPDFAGSEGLKVDVPNLARVGYKWLPEIAADVLQAVRLAGHANRPGPWTRAGNIGMGAVGPYEGWQVLYASFETLLTSSASEIVAAGEKLAQGAGYLRDADGWSDAALGKHRKELEGAGHRYQAPNQYTAVKEGSFSHIPGDTNADGHVDGEDSPPLTDTNGDGKVDQKDAGVPDFNGDGKIDWRDQLAAELAGG